MSVSRLDCDSPLQMFESGFEMKYHCAFPPAEPAMAMAVDLMPNSVRMIPAIHRRM